MKKITHNTDHDTHWMIEGFSKHDLVWVGVQLTAAIGMALALAFLLNDMLARI